jgi:2-polyprenyl-6-methoxyphenol hydroxylase-like FAD-dependent oxidoreductase
VGGWCCWATRAPRYVLAEELAAAPTVEAGLERYERNWRPVTTDRQEAGRRAARWFLPASQGQVRLRRIALKLGRLPGLDRALVRTIAGDPTPVVARPAAR